MVTLYELGPAIAGIKNKKRFEELHLGPLCKIPIVHRLFTIDSNTKDDDIHQIETVDLLRVRSFIICIIFAFMVGLDLCVCVLTSLRERKRQTRLILFLVNRSVESS